MGKQDTSDAEITVENVNDDPLAAALAAMADQGEMVVLTRDFIDLNTDDSHTFTVDTTGTADTVLAKSEGTIEYSANAFCGLTAGETAMDTFNYTVTDAAGKSSTATASVLINWLNDDVVAADDTFDGTTDRSTIMLNFARVNDAPILLGIEVFFLRRQRRGLL